MSLGKMNFGECTPIWNPWIGCKEVSEACENCYVLPHNCFIDKYIPFVGNYPEGTLVSVGLKTDFFLEEADHLRKQAWDTIRENKNLIFLIITKRIERVLNCLPEDWGTGYENVIIAVTAENQKMANLRIPELIKLPAKHKWVTCSPLLEEIDLSQFLSSGEIEMVEVTGERGIIFPARPTYFSWCESLSKQCKEYEIRFALVYLGYNFIMPDGSVVQSHPRWYHNTLEDSLGLQYYKPLEFKLSNITKIY